MATATENGRRTRVSTGQIVKWVESIDKDAVTTGDVMQQFHVSRSVARDRLLALASEGMLIRVGNGGGAKYAKRLSGNGSAAAAKPVLAAAEADVTTGLIPKLRADCDQELARLGAEIEALQTAEDEIAKQKDALHAESARVARAKAALTGK